MRSLPLALLVALLVSGCAAAAPPTGPDPGAPGPVAQECPASVDLPDPPQRVVAMDAASAAFLVRLGLGDRIVGIASTGFAEDFTGDLRARLDALPTLAEDKANRESVLAADPDFVTAISALQLGGFDGTPSAGQLRDNGIAVMVACGLSETGFRTDLEPTYTYITNLAAAFDVPDRGAQLIAELRAEITAAGPPAPLDVPVLLLTSVPDGGGGINTRGGGSYVNALVSLAGGRNLAGELPGNFVSLSAEQVATADPAVIVVLLGFTDQSPEQLVSAIASSPLLAGTTAVREGTIVALPQTYTLSPSLLNARAVEVIAAAVAA